MKIWRVMVLSGVASLSAACMQDRAAPVAYHGNEVYKKEGRYDLQGNELPKYSSDHPANLESHIADKYVSQDAEYGVAAELDSIQSTDITHLDSQVSSSSFTSSAPATMLSVPAVDNAAVSSQGDQESFFAKIKRNANELADAIDNSIQQNATGQGHGVATPPASSPQVSTAAMRPPLTTPSSINISNTMTPQPQLQPVSPPSVAVISAKDAPPPLNPRATPAVNVAAPPAPASVNVQAPSQHYGAVTDATDAMNKMNKAMEDKTAHVQPSNTPAVNVVVPETKPVEKKVEAKTVKVDKADATMIEEEVTRSDTPAAPMQEVGGQVEQELKENTVKTAVALPAKDETAETEKQLKEDMAAEVGSMEVDNSDEMLWPVKGKLISKFGDDKGGHKNDGVNIAAKKGAPIRAVGDGTVIYADSRLKEYGNMIIIQHSNGYLSAYAHAGELTVSKGDTVKRGQLIATVGKTGDVDKPQLHFALRKDRQPVDPETVLTK